MDKVKIQEIAEEAGLSNGELIEKAKELGFNVKAANSTISMDDAGVLVDYAISGRLPKGFKKPGDKPKLKVVKKNVTEEAAAEKTPVEELPVSEEVSAEQEPVVESEAAIVTETVPEKESEPEVEEVEAVESKVETEVAEEKTEEVSVPEPVVLKEPKQRRGISVVSKKADSETSSESEENKPKRRVLSRTGIKIVRKAKPAPVRAATRISMGSGMPTPPSKKKVKKGPAEARETGKKIDIFNHDSMSGDIDSGFGEEEVVLLDFSDKNIYEDMMRQEQKRREEAKKREAANGGPAKGRQPFRPQQRRSLKRGGKRKKYTKEEHSEVVTSVEIPENVRVYEFAEKVNRSVGEVVKVLFALGMMVTKNDFLSKDEIEILAEEFEVEVTTMNPLDELDYVQVYDAEEDTNLVEELGVDSLDMVDLVLAMEQEFGIEIKDEDITPDIKTVRDIVALLGKYLKF